MKKSLLLGITWITLIALTATTLYAQTVTGSGAIARMKAAVASFTLAWDLNPGQTGLQSAPLSGKKTGDILTAGEYNRILEVIANVGGGISDVELITSQAASPSATADYSFRVSQANCPAGKKVISGGCSYPNTLNTFVHNTPTPDLTGWICGWLHHDGDTTNNTTKYPYRPTAYAVCGTYGSGGGSSGWTDVSLIGDTPFDKTCEYRFYMNAMWLDGVYYVTVVAPTKLVYIAHSSVVSSIPSNNKTSYQVDWSPAYTVSKIEKRCN